VRSMEIFRRLGLTDRLRAVAVPEDHPLDVAWVTTMTGHELHRFRYPTVAEWRTRIREVNDGSQPLEPPMRVSQVEIEPVLKRALEASRLVEVRFGVAFEELAQDAESVVAVLRTADGSTERVRCRYLAGCDGGGSRVREQLGIRLSGQARIMERFMTHFRSDEKDLLLRWGPAWHYQSSNGTVISQNDRDVFTLHTRLATGQSRESTTPSGLLETFVGRPFRHEILVANPWAPHLLVADAYARGRVFLGGDAVHQYIPTGGYGMNTGIGDAFDLGWKLAAVAKGHGGPALLASYEEERRPVGLRNREASHRHNGVRVEIGGLYGPELRESGPAGDDARAVAARRIAAIGNAENESWGIEYGYWYGSSSAICREAGAAAPDDPLRYEPTTIPGVRLPSVHLPDGTALYDRLGRWFTLILFGSHDAGPLQSAAEARGLPLEVLRIDDPEVAAVFGVGQLLVRPDHHIAWRGGSVGGRRDAERILERVLGHEELVLA
jgi:2-polyprenyl-6-methoxyphenol hydroxylase-like FAD-dependent oxidoreductase